MTDPSEVAPFVVPVGSPSPAPKATSLTPVVHDERAITRLLETMFQRGGLSVGEAARRLGTTPQNVRQYVRGRRNPSLMHVLKLAEVCGVRVLVDIPTW